MFSFINATILINMASHEESGVLEARNQESKNPPLFEFKDAASLEEYLAWKEEVPIEFRRFVEAKLKGIVPRPSETGLPSIDEFLNTFAKIIEEKDFDLTSVSKKVANLLKPLARIETQGGHLNVFETLTNPDASWSLKKTIYETQIKAALEWLANRDLETLTKKAKEEAPQEETKEKGNEQDTDLPSSSEDVASSMEGGMTKKEGEPAKALFTVKPFFGGYYKQLVFNQFDPATLKWGKPENEFSDTPSETIDPLSVRVVMGRIRPNAPLAFPVPYGWSLDQESMPAGFELTQNQDGLPYVTAKTKDGRYAITMGRCLTLGEEQKPSPMEISGELDSELKKKIDTLKQSKLPPMKLKREIVKLVRGHLTYSNSPEAYQKYVKTPAKYFQKVWEHKEADCFVANTLAVRALAEVDSRVRFVGGYFVKDKDKDGNAIMHQGNGHAWLEVWDEMSGRAVRLDATPKGDPNVDEEQQERELEGEGGEGDYGDEEIAGDKEAKEKIQEMKGKDGQGKGQTKRPSFELAEDQFSELAECTPLQAREFLNALERVRAIKNGHDVSISESMKDEWRKIMQERKVELRNFKGPVRMDQGTNLEDPVSALIDIRSGEFNPTGFEKEEVEQKIQTEFGGIDIYFSFDLSGSMGQPDAASGRSKADVQRDIALLFVDSLMQCAFMTRQHGEDSALLPIKIMVTLASDTGEVKLHLTDRWGPKEQYALYSALIQTARGGTPTHQTLQLIEKDYKTEKDELKKKRIPKAQLPVHYAPIITDGVPDDRAETARMRTVLKTQGMLSRNYIVGGVASDDDIAVESFSQLPRMLQKDIIELIHTLRPKQAQP